MEEQERGKEGIEDGKPEMGRREQRIRNQKRRIGNGGWKTPSKGTRDKRHGTRGSETRAEERGTLLPKTKYYIPKSKLIPCCLPSTLYRCDITKEGGVHTYVHLDNINRAFTHWNDEYLTRH